jgi:hypothetical protein
LAYLHVVDGLAFGFHQLGEPMTLAEFRKLFHGPLIGNCGYTQETAESDCRGTRRPNLLRATFHQQPGPRGALQERLAACRTSANIRLVFAHRGERVHRFPGLRIAGGKQTSVTWERDKEPFAMTQHSQAASKSAVAIQVYVDLGRSIDQTSQT